MENTFNKLSRDALETAIVNLAKANKAALDRMTAERDVLQSRVNELENKEMRCPYCDGSGEVHRADGEWLGTCTCPEGLARKGGEND